MCEWGLTKHFSSKHVSHVLIVVSEGEKWQLRNLRGDNLWQSEMMKNNWFFPDKIDLLFLQPKKEKIILLKRL